MSENTGAVETTDETTDEATPLAETKDTQPEAEHQDEQDDTKAQNAEAAKYRRRLREAQAELKTVTAQLDAVQRQQIEAMLEPSGVKPEAIWAVTELAELLDDTGSIDPDKLAGAIEAAREKFGIPKISKGNYVPGVGNQPSAIPRADAWTDAFKPKSR